MAYKAIIAGASGLIGSKLVEILLTSPEYDEVVILVRKTTGLQHKKLIEIVIDFDRLEEYKEQIMGMLFFAAWAPQIIKHRIKLSIEK
jgi:NAD dependent epimerase/dehydratase family enzyme